MATRGLMLLLVLALVACGGRSSLEPGEIFSSSGGSAPHASPTPTAGHSATVEPEPNPDPDPDPDPDPGPDPDPDPGPGPTPTPTPDVNCTSDNAKGGMACTAACVTTCGYYSLGTKTCDCVNGVFVSCHCPRPLYYQGATTAPACATPDGRTHWLDNTPCESQWAECIGTDPVSGSNPRGCLCLTDPVNGKLEWTCGSTNKWFLPE